MGVLWDSTVGEVQFRATKSASIGAGVKFQSLPIQRAEELEAAFDRAVRERVQGMVVLSSPLILAQRAHIAGLALKVRLPTISLFTLFPTSGALMAYGPDLTDLFRRAGTYIDRILKGAKAGELPIERPSQVLPGHQPRHGEGSRPRCAADLDRPRRRGDRIGLHLLRCIWSLMAQSGHCSPSA